MPKTLFTCFLLISSWSVKAQSTEEQLQTLLQAYHQADKLNGSVLITQGGKVLLDQGYGLRNVGANLKNDTSTIFSVGSVTKQFTAAVILKLQELKKLKVTDRLSKYFPDYPKGDSIRLSHLLTHTSGIFNYAEDPVFMQSKATKPMTENEMITMIANKPLTFSPGSNWSYSNSNYVMLGYIIQKVYKKPYAEAVKDLLLTPLQMNETGFDFARLKNDRRAVGYRAISENGGEERSDFDYSVSFAAGGMYSTTHDLYKWTKGLSSGKILNKQSLDIATTPLRNKYGYGMYIDSINGKRYLAHGGLTFGFTAYVGTILEDGVTIIILNNVANSSIAQIANNVLAVLYNKPYQVPVPEKEIFLDVNELSNYLGVYELTPQISIVFSVEDGKLMGQVSNQPKVTLHAQEEGLFFVKGTDIRVQFIKDVAGNVGEVKIIEGKLVTNGKKIK